MPLHLSDNRVRSDIYFSYLSAKSDPGQSVLSNKDLVPSVNYEITSGQRNVPLNKPVVTSATSSSKPTSQESSSEFQRNVTVDNTTKMSFKDTHIQGKGILFVKGCSHCEQVTKIAQLNCIFFAQNVHVYIKQNVHVFVHITLQGHLSSACNALEVAKLDENIFAVDNTSMLITFLYRNCKGT